MEFARWRGAWALLAWLATAVFLLLLLLGRSFLVGQPGLHAADLVVALIGATAALTIPWIVTRVVSLVLMRRVQRGWRPPEPARMPRTTLSTSSQAAMDRFDTFSDGLRHVLVSAQEEAQRLNHNYIGTEHLLLGLAREREGVAARALQKMGVDLSGARTALEFIIGRGPLPIAGEVGLTPRAKRVIELAIDEARISGADLIGTEHLLLALVREGEGIAAGVLQSLGVGLDQARAAVKEELGGQA
jgi:hypothetical protein